MPDLYVNSAAGSDTAGGGDTTADPLRSLTFAVSEASRRFLAARTTIRLAAGTYSAATGEVFPIEMAQNISVLGAGEGSTIILFERMLAGAGPGASFIAFENALSGGEELADFTLQGLPRDLGACYTSTGIRQTMGTTNIHDITIEAAPGTPAGDVAFGTGVALGNAARAERVRVSGCGNGIGFGGGDAYIVRCTLTDNDRSGVWANGLGMVEDCDFDNNHTNVRVINNSPAIITGNRISNGAWGVWAAGIGGPAIEVRNNVIRNSATGIAAFSDALIEDNDIYTQRGQTGVLSGATSSAVRSTLVVRPVLRDNRFRRDGRADRSRLSYPLATFGGAAQPILEGNRFWSVEGVSFGLIWVYNDAIPDFGGGAGGSRGGNRFENGWLVFFQDPLSPRKEIFAENNFWLNAPPRRGVDVHGPADWYVDPYSRRDSVVLRTAGARRV